ncbi:hypothetical protein A1O1_05272 [Capronia coronata CBS 617.96]|uniref:Uncharacterized protein n=1 Tax=Capronia coronata CBS 617.96 TaxID=1182541 RepID=W9Y6A2_9EURO|nr:uncharacterized protein A1O1_05272 [Capronia coronata CBS 617.96]EXJ88342.1 hypothetical protein A1O1_05272 [Capronia coronata CBS 617.96]
MPPQLGPTSTVYGGIMTEYFYAVECHLCNVTNFDNNPAPQGPFTTRTTSSMLTVTRVECIPETSVTTRGVYDRQEESKKLSPRPKHYNTPNRRSGSQAVRRSDTNTVLEQMAVFMADITPSSQTLSGPALDSEEEIMSAMFAINVADSGLNVALACQQVQTTAARVQMLDSGLKPDLVQNLLCWIADHGYDFNTNRQEVYSTLQAALWGLGVAGGYTTNRTEICGNLGLFNTIGDYLGIHVAQYQSLVCSDLSSATPSLETQNATAATSSLSSNLTTSALLTAWPSNVTFWGSGSSWPGHNSTTWGPPVSFTGTIGTGVSATGNPQTNNVTFLTGTAAASGMATGPSQTNNTGPIGTGSGTAVITGSPQTYNVSLSNGTGAAPDSAADSLETNNATQPTGTDGASGVTTALLNQTFMTTCTPPTPTARLFFPAISTTNSHYLFKGY